MTSTETSQNRFIRIDELTKQDHPHLVSEDKCFFTGEYIPGVGYEKSGTNSLMHNFKKSPDRKSQPFEWKHKEKAINQVAKAYAIALGSDAINSLTFVPIPPSKARGDPLYDNRLTRMLHAMKGDYPADIRKLVLQSESTTPSHESSHRPSRRDIEALYSVVKANCLPEPKIIAVVDDVITTGAHFKAAQSILKKRFSNSKIYGLSIAR